MLSRIARPIALAALSTALSASTVVGAPERASGSGPVLGLAIDREAAARWTGDAPRDPGRRLLVRLAARWDEVETEPGVYDWSRIEPAVEALDQAGCRVMLVLGGGNRLYAAEGQPPSPEAGESLHAWTAFVRSAVRSFAGRVSVFEIGYEQGLILAGKS